MTAYAAKSIMYYIILPRNNQTLLHIRSLLIRHKPVSSLSSYFFYRLITTG